MEMSTDRYIEYASKDFFYMMLRDPTPPKADGAGPWIADAGTQPSPAWSPGIWTSKLGDVTLLSIDAGRSRYRMAAGTGEPDSKTGSQPAHEIDEEAKKRVVLSLELGVGADRRPGGLIIEGKHVLPISDRADAVLVQKDGRLAITSPDDPALASPGIDATVLPRILHNGAPLAHSDVGVMHRAALCTSSDGRTLVAHGEVGSSKLAEALKAAGCSEAVLLDRGEHAYATIRRAGTNSPPIATSHATVLFVLAEPLAPRALHLGR
jgi:hypothetical protein